MLQDPDVAAQLAAAPDDDSPPPIEGFGPVVARLAAIEDRITQLLWATARADPSAAPSVPRPEFPHVALREQQRRARMDNLTSTLTGGD